MFGVKIGFRLCLSISKKRHAIDTKTDRYREREIEKNILNDPGKRQEQKTERETQGKPELVL